MSNSDLNSNAQLALKELAQTITLLGKEDVSKINNVNELLHVLDLAQDSKFRPVKKSLVQFIAELNVDELAFFEGHGHNLKEFENGYRLNAGKPVKTRTEHKKINMNNDRKESSLDPAKREDPEVKSVTAGKRRIVYRGKEKWV